MRRAWATLFFTAGLLIAAAKGAEAVDFRAKGVWIANFEYGSGGAFTERGRSRGGREGRRTSGWGRYGEDEFEAKSRIRLQLTAVASEALSGTVYFEIGKSVWGEAKSGGALGTDGKVVKIKHAYLDWTVPDTALKIRMGLQRIDLPDFVTEASQAFDADVAAVVLSDKISDTVSVTAFWARPYNDNWTGNAGTWDGSYYVNSNPQNFMDNMDLFGLLVPLRFDGITVTPWAMLGGIGPNTSRTVTGDPAAGTVLFGRNAAGWGALGLTPAVYALKNYQQYYNARPNAAVTDTRTVLSGYSTAFWAGLTGEVIAFDPFRLAWSANYGGVYTGVQALDRHGWYGSLLAEYKCGWGTPGLYGWYTSGDDGNIKNGSERMPTIEDNNESTNALASFGTLGTLTLGRDTLLGSTFVGTWGVGVRVKDVSLLENLKQTLHVNYLGGTNSPSMAKYIKGAKAAGGRGGEWWQYAAAVTPDTGRGTADFNSADFYGLYLTTLDSAMEFGLTSEYKIYENLKLLVEANYIALWLDQSRSVWGGFTDPTDGQWIGSNSTADAWNVNVSFIYKF